MRFYRVNAKNVSEVAAEIVSVGKSVDHYVEAVRRVVEDVRARGDEALIEYVKKFDSPAMDLERLRVPVEKLADAYARLDDATKKALKISSENIARVCKSQLRRLFSSVRVEEGVLVVQRPSPLSSVGCYVPGGGAAYPSTVLMTVVPAKVAQVPRIAVFTPPTREGNIPTVVAAALYLTGVKEVYCAGGPQAIAAMAYGTESIKPVAKIIGPGGPYVTAAKKLVSRDVAVDMLAGPTELCVYADDVADAENVALEMCAQAEHSTDTLVGLVTTSDELVNEVLKFLKLITPRLERGEIVNEALRKNGYVVVCDKPVTAAALIQALAPEHLYIVTKHEKLLQSVTNAGLISIGRYTSPALCDYVVGVNHVLPTMGQAAVRGGLSILDYVKIVTEVRMLKGAAKRLGRHAALLARAEGLTAHAAAASKTID